MPGGSRSLPGRPNLRYLKLEAKRRVAAGEFPTLHEAQLGWTAPTDDELKQHFDEGFLTALPPSELIAAIGRLSKDLRDGELVVLRQTPLQAYAQLADVQYIAAVQAEPPLVADGAIGLDRPVNDHLRAVRLADGTITVRELLSHTAGVVSPTEMYADAVPDLAALMGPVIACTGPRGTVDPSNGGCAVLGQLVADAGANFDATAAVTTRIRDQRTHVVLTSRLIPVNTIETRLLRAWTNPA